MTLFDSTVFEQVEAMKAQAEAVRKYAHAIAAQCNEIENLCTTLTETCVCSSLTESVVMDISGELDQAFFSLRLSVFEAYKALVQPQTFGFRRSASVAAVEDFQKYNDSVEKIFACVENDILHIKLPLLWSRGRYKSWGNGGANDYDYLHWFTVNLDAALTLIGDKIPRYRHKNICYLFVADARKTPIDSDNYDTKSITDTIVSHMPGGDSALNCSFVYTSATSAKLDPGTYITVSESKNIMLNIEEQCEGWEHLMAGGKNDGFGK